MGKGGRGRGRGRGGGDPIAGIVGWLAKHLGACVSVQRSEEGDVLRTKNDYELVGANIFCRVPCRFLLLLCCVSCIVYTAVWGSMLA